MNKTLATRKPGLASRSSLGRLFPGSLFDEMFDQFWSEGNRPLSEAMNAAMDVAETDQAFEVKMDLPGVNVDDVDIQIDNNTLTVRGQRCEESEENDPEKQFHRIERHTGSFSRSVVLPSSVNEDETVAEFKDGVLDITIAKADDAKPRRISIKT